MGIGISFTGRDGTTRTMQAETPADVRAALELVQSATSQTMGALGKRRSQHVTNITNILNKIKDDQKKKDKNGSEGKVKINADDTLQYLEDKIHPLGSVDCDKRFGLRLHGDVANVSGKVYGGNKDDERGFFKLAEFDPAAGAGAVVVGPVSSTSKECDESKREATADSPFTLPMMTRIAIVEDKVRDRVYSLYCFVRLVAYTGFGRACSVSGEQRISVGELDLRDRGVVLAGTDGSESSCSKKFTFESANDSNVVVSMRTKSASDKLDESVVTIGVYYS